MARCQFDAFRWNQAGKRVMWLRQMFMHGADHFFQRMGAGDFQHLRVFFANTVIATAQTAGHDNLTVFGDGFADTVQRFFDG